jgi:hypothetical protein
MKRASLVNLFIQHMLLLSEVTFDAKIRQSGREVL